MEFILCSEKIINKVILTPKLKGSAGVEILALFVCGVLLSQLIKLE